MSAVLAWHFVGATLRDGRPVPPDGEWLVHDGPVKMCESGLHASRDAFDALFYAPGDVLCRVECDDIVDEMGDKLVCRRRRILRRIDAGPLLRDYARWCALQVIYLWDAPPVVREFLESGDAALWEDAFDSARSAWRAAAKAGYASRGVFAARAAARVAVGTTTWALAVGDALAASRSDAIAAARAEFNRRVEEAFT